MPPRRANAHTSTDPNVILPSILKLLASTPPDAYSAHQKARTTAARLDKGHPEAAIEVLFGVAKELMKLGEWGSAVDLGVYLVSVYEKSEVQVSVESRARLTQLIALLPAQGTWRKKLIDSSIKWSATQGESPAGDPDLHQYVGGLYYQDRMYVPAEVHLIASGKRDAAVTLAEMMFEWSGKGEDDIAPYACRGVLPFLALKPPSILPASTFLTKLLSLATTANPSLLASGVDATDSHIKLTTSPTLNFLQLAILVTQRAPAPGASAVQMRGTNGGIAREWESLVRRYSSMGGCLRQPEIQEVLQAIGTNAFLIPPPRGAGGNDMLQNLMGSLFGGGGGGGAR